MARDIPLRPDGPDGVATAHGGLKPAPLLARNWQLFRKSGLAEPVIDLACGDGHNGIFLAAQGIPVVLIDLSAAKLEAARRAAQKAAVKVQVKRWDLEQGESSPLAVQSAGGFVIFRYLHRPLMPAVKAAVKKGGIVIYETFTRDQTRFGRPHNPDFLLRPGELRQWFLDWQILHYFEGTMPEPDRAMAQIVCRKIED